jgi:hypothetical protein
LASGVEQFYETPILVNNDTAVTLINPVQLYGIAYTPTTDASCDAENMIIV